MAAGTLHDIPRPIIEPSATGYRRKEEGWTRGSDLARTRIALEFHIGSGRRQAPHRVFL